MVVKICKRNLCSLAADFAIICGKFLLFFLMFSHVSRSESATVLVVVASKQES